MAMYKEMIEQAQNCIELCRAWIEYYTRIGNELKVSFWRRKLNEYNQELGELQACIG